MAAAVRAKKVRRWAGNHVLMGVAGREVVRVMVEGQPLTYLQCQVEGRRVLKSSLVPPRDQRQGRGRNGTDSVRLIPPCFGRVDLGRLGQRRQWPEVKWKKRMRDDPGGERREERAGGVRLICGQVGARNRWTTLSRRIARSLWAKGGVLDARNWSYSRMCGTKLRLEVGRIEMCRLRLCESPGLHGLLRWPGCQPGWDRRPVCPSPADVRVGGMMHKLVGGLVWRMEHNKASLGGGGGKSSGCGSGSGGCKWLSSHPTRLRHRLSGR